jgi:hypothetical protein
VYNVVAWGVVGSVELEGGLSGLGGI